MKKKKVMKKKVGRPAGQKPLLALRIERRLYDRLVETAEASERTLAEESVRRLAASFTAEDAAGGAEMHRFEMMMTATFAYTGQQYAIAEGHRDWTPRDWLADQDCYRAALLALNERLFFAMPNRSKKEIDLFFSALKDRISTRYANETLV